MDPEQTDSQSRQVELERLYLRNREHIRNTALENPNLLAPDADNIADNVVQHLLAYDGQLTDADFLEWSCEIAKSAADRICRLQEILEEHGGAIRGAIRSALYSVSPRDRFDDNDALTEEIFQEVSLLVLKYLDSLTQPGSADLSTRLFGLAKRHTELYHLKKAQRRHRAVRRWLERGRLLNVPEVVSKEELAALRAEQRQPCS